MRKTAYINTIDFGYVPVRKTYTDGRFLKNIELSDDGTNAQFAEIRADYTTEQPFAVLFDGGLETTIKGRIILPFLLLYMNI